MWINGDELGQAPVKLKVKSWSVRPNAYRYHAEKPGYLPGDGYVQPHLSVSRIIAAAFSSCFTCSFHGFFEFDDETEIALLPDASPLDAATTQDPLAARLRTLKQLNDEGLITADEYHKYKEDVLRAAVAPPSTENRGPSLPELIQNLIGPFPGAPGRPLQ